MSRLPEQLHGSNIYNTQGNSFTEIQNLPKDLTDNYSGATLNRIARKLGLLKRVEPQYICPLCNSIFLNSHLQGHHCIPIWAGGGGEVSNRSKIPNIVFLCGPCHRIADDLSMLGFFLRPNTSQHNIFQSLTDIGLLEPNDPCIAYPGRLLRAKRVIVPEVRRLNGEPMGAVYHSNYLINPTTLETITEKHIKINSSFGRAYQRRNPPQTSCRRSTG